VVADTEDGESKYAALTEYELLTVELYPPISLKFIIVDAPLSKFNLTYVEAAVPENPDPFTNINTLLDVEPGVIVTVNPVSTKLALVVEICVAREVPCTTCNTLPVRASVSIVLVTAGAVSV
jgi:hypothetical protein